MLVHRLRKARLHHFQAVLHINLGHFRIGAGLERRLDRGAAETALGFKIQQVIGPVEFFRVFQGSTVIVWRSERVIDADGVTTVYYPEPTPGRDLLYPGKTKDFAGALEKLGLDRRTLIVAALDNHNLALSSRNLPNITYVAPNGVNVYDLLTHEGLALTREAASALDKQLAK